MEESIYNIIPKEYTPPPKEPLYRSKFPPNIKPTGSTFCHHTTSKPIVKVVSFRMLTLEESSNTVSKHILSTAIPKLLGMLRMTVNLLLKIS
jgi:hypothetical protein